MSTIGFGLSTKVTSDALKQLIIELTNSHGYSVSFDFTVIESEVIEGVEALVKLKELNFVSLLHSPPRPNVALAYDIDVEMRNAVPGQTALIFFTFLKELSLALENWVDEFTVFFADEWYSDLRIRKMEGPLDDLINILVKDGGWGIRLYNLKRNWWEMFEDFPLVFTVKL